MKKFLILSLFLILSISFTGCSSEKNQESSDNSNNDSSQVSNDSSSNNSDSETAEYKVGDTINFEGEEITITDVQRNYDTGNEYIKPKEGKEFIKISINLKNVSEKEISVSALEFNLQDSNGAIMSIAAPTYSLDDYFDSVKLISEGAKSGSVVFEAPKDDANLKLIYQPSFLSDKKLTIAL